MASQNPQLLAIYTGGIAWLDHAMRASAMRQNFVERHAGAADRHAGFNRLSQERIARAGPGDQVFRVGAQNGGGCLLHQPRSGSRIIGYMGNTAVSKFEVPQEAIDYALKRSPV